MTYLSIEQVRPVHVEEPLVLLHPDLDGPGGVDTVRVLVPGESVGVEAPEDVADPAAGDGLQDAPALPDPERHLQVLPAPHLHLLVVAPELPESRPGYREQPPGHGGRPGGGDGAASPRDFYMTSLVQVSPHAELLSASKIICVI